MRRIAATLLLTIVCVAGAPSGAAAHTNAAPTATAAGCHTKACWRRVHEARARRWCTKDYKCRWRRRYYAQSPSSRAWAVSTASCESGNNPRAVGGGGTYRGALQFDMGTWDEAQGYIPDEWDHHFGDPVSYSYSHQMTVGIKLMQRVGTGRWPVCG